MYADVTRDTFDPDKPEGRLRFQQGRAPLDAELNEQADLLRAAVQRLAGDVHGPYWGPGFVPWLDESIPPPGLLASLDLPGGRVTVGPGAYVVRGRAIESRADRTFPFPADRVPEPAERLVLALEVVERPVLPYEDPTRLDPAFGTWDGASRSELAWTLRAIAAPQKAFDDDKTAIDNIKTLDAPAKTDLKNAIDNRTPDVFLKKVGDLQLDRPLTAQLTRMGQRISLDVALKAFADSMAPSAATDRSVVRLRAFHRLAAAAGLTPQERGRLRATVNPAGAKPGADPGESCHPATTPSGYRGREDGLYRVEIHRDGFAYTDDPKARMLWKWARDNASVTIGVTRIGKPSPPPEKGTETPVLRSFSAEVAGLLDDARLGLRVGQVVELNAASLQGGSLVLPDAAFPLLRVTEANPETGTLTLQGFLTTEQTLLLGELVDPVKPVPMYLRRWDHPAQKDTDDADDAQKDAGQALSTLAEPPGDSELREAPIPWSLVEIEAGLYVEFETDRPYRRGDFWLIPARVGQGLLWPDDPDVASGITARWRPSRSSVEAHAPLLLHPGGGAVDVDCRRVAPIAVLVVEP